MKKNIRTMKKAANRAAKINLRRGTALLWNGGVTTVHEYLRGVMLPAGYSRLVIDRIGDRHGAIVVDARHVAWVFHTRRIDNMLS